jgi:uncharacterized PurR-regulated membrane protein YhhQ (DUF165 family)
MVVDRVGGLARDDALPAAAPCRPPAAVGQSRSHSWHRAVHAFMTHPTFDLQALWRPVLAMAIVIVLSNYAVQFPINDWLTWGAFTYPVVFLVTDLTNRACGPRAARRVAWAGFAIAVVASLAVAPWRIAVASGTAFIASQLMDVALFNRWRQANWWKAPLFGSLVASAVDTAIFFFLAFAGTDMDWLLLALGDLAMKLAMSLVLLAPYRALLPRLSAWAPQA